MKVRALGFFLLLISLPAGGVAAQQPDPAAGSPSVQEINKRLVEYALGSASQSPTGQAEYRIGAEDLLEVGVFEVPELSRTVRVSVSGEITLPLVGQLRVAGLTVAESEQVLVALLKDSFLKDPQVTIFIKEYRSDPVSVVGAVKQPGLHYIQTRRTLLEVLAMAGGLSEGARQAGRQIVVTRKYPGGNRPVVLTASGGSQEAATPAGGPAVVDVPIKELLETGDPRWNIPIYPGDIVRVVPAGTVYVAGDVKRPGAFPLTDFDNVSLIQALAMAGGMERTANPSKALVIRRDDKGARLEEEVNLKRVQQGKDPDLSLGPNDILFVPGSVSKAGALRAIESAIQIGTGLVIWRR